MYLVTHVGQEYPVYESCHHCSFIRVPELEKLQAQVKEYEKLAEDRGHAFQAAQNKTLLENQELKKDNLAFTGIIREKDKIIERQDKSLLDLVEALEQIARMGFSHPITIAEEALAKHKQAKKEGE
jgi:hypothetical protein